MAAALTEEQQEKVNSASKTSENMMVAYLTAYLSPLLSCKGTFRSLVNSENFAWLEVMKGHPELNGKPDLWLGPSYIVSQRAAPTTNEAEAEPNKHEQKTEALVTARSQLRHEAGSSLEYVFGTPLSTAWYDSIHTLAAKTTFTDKAMGEQIQYLQHLSPHAADKMSRGMLCTAETFSLITCHKGGINDRVTGQWVQPGTHSLIRDFLSVASPWEVAVRSLCSHFTVQPLLALGRGGTARVIL